MTLLKLLPLLLFTVLGIPIQAILLKIAPPVARWVPVVYHRLLLTTFGVRVHVERGPLQKKQSGSKTKQRYYISNHISWLDIAVLSALEPTRFVARGDMATWPLVGLLSRLQKTVFITRNKHKTKEDIQTLTTQKDKTPLVLFAEGTTGDGFEVLPLKSALLQAPLQTSQSPADELTEIEIIPVTLKYTHIGGLPISRATMPFVAWYGDMELLSHAGRLLRLGGVDVRVIFGEPISPKTQDRKALTHAVQQEIEKGFYNKK